VTIISIMSEKDASGIDEANMAPTSRLAVCQEEGEIPWISLETWGILALEIDVGVQCEPRPPAYEPDRLQSLIPSFNNMTECYISVFNHYYAQRFLGDLADQSLPPSGPDMHLATIEATRRLVSLRLHVLDRSIDRDTVE